MSQKLNDIYRSILKFAGMEADSQGYISVVLESRRKPAILDGKQLVLPTDEHLRNHKPEEHVIFHLLTESPLRGESEVFAKLKSVINVRLNYTIGVIASNLLNLVASPEFHKKLNPDQQELLTFIADADEKSQSTFTSIMMSGIKEDAERTFSNIYIKRGGTFNGKRFSRVGVVTFPFYEKLIEGKFDKIRVKDKETFKQLFEFMFPNINEPEEYNYGSSSQVAPYMDSLMITASNIASRLNDLLVMYKDFIEDAESIMFDSEWTDAFQNLDSLASEIRKVPVQFGNDGVIEVVGRTVDAAPAAVQQQGTAVSTVVNQQPQMHVAPVYNGQPQMQPVPQQQQQQPGVRKTSRGLDFRSLVQNNPQMAMTPNPLAPQLYMQEMQNWQQQQMMQQQQQPTWAAPPAPQQMMYGAPQQQPQIVNTPNGPMYVTPQGYMPVPPHVIQQMMMNQAPSWAGGPRMY